MLSSVGQEKFHLNIGLQPLELIHIIASSSYFTQQQSAMEARTIVHIFIDQIQEKN